VFLTTEEDRASRVTVGTGGEEKITLARRGCSIYPVRPLQCRTWPFWDTNLASKSAWDRAAQRCHGMDHGRRTFSREQMEALRDAADWPDDPPTSAPKEDSQEYRGA